MQNICNINKNNKHCFNHWYEYFCLMVLLLNDDNWFLNVAAGFLSTERKNIANTNWKWRLKVILIENRWWLILKTVMDTSTSGNLYSYFFAVFFFARKFFHLSHIFVYDLSFLKSMEKLFFWNFLLLKSFSSPQEALKLSNVFHRRTSIIPQYFCLF